MLATVISIWARLDELRKAMSPGENTKGAVRLAGFLAGSSLAGFASSQTSIEGIAGMGLGWSLSPGPFVTIAVIVAGLYGLVRGTPMRSLMVITVLFLLPLFVEYLPGPWSVRALVGLSSVLLGCCWVTRSQRGDLAWRAACFVVAAYIQSVFFYNFFLCGQMMYFFRPGWTL